MDCRARELKAVPNTNCLHELRAEALGLYLDDISDACRARELKAVPNTNCLHELRAEALGLHFGDDFVDCFSRRNHRENICIGTDVAVNNNGLVHLKSLCENRLDFLRLCDS